MRGLFLVWCGFAGCTSDGEGDDTGDTDDTHDGALAIAGSYVDAFGTTYDISEEAWVQQYVGYDSDTYHVLSFDNAERRIIAHNAPENSYNGNLFSAFDWLDAGDGHLWVCQIEYDAATEADAEATARADDSDPSTSGCGGFAWTDLTP